MIASLWSPVLPAYLDTPPDNRGHVCNCTREGRMTVSEDDCSCGDTCKCHAEPNRIADLLNAREEARL